MELLNPSLRYKIVKMNFELLSWFGNFINFLIFMYIAINIINTSCFDIFQMTLSVVGLLASIFIQMVSITYQNFYRLNNKRR